MWEQPHTAVKNESQVQIAPSRQNWVAGGATAVDVCHDKNLASHKAEGMHIHSMQ